jgi:plasmid maintenance system antidote protein VapI
VSDIDRLAEQWPAAHFIEEELHVRAIPIGSFLIVVGITPTRWELLHSGEKIMLLSESCRIAGALGVSPEFIMNLNLSYSRWRKAKS